LVLIKGFLANNVLESGVDLPFNLIGLTTNALLAGLTIFFYTGTTFLMGCVFF